MVWSIGQLAFARFRLELPYLYQFQYSRDLRSVQSNGHWSPCRWLRVYRFSNELGEYFLILDNTLHEVLRRILLSYFDWRKSQPVIDKPSVFYLSNSPLDFFLVLVTIFDERINFEIILIEPAFPLLSFLSKWCKGGSFLEAFLRSSHCRGRLVRCWSK